MEDVKKLVGVRIRQLRKQRKLSQEELGYKSGLHYTHIGAIERGEKNWSIDTLVKVAGGLNVTINDLLVLPSKPEEIKKLKKVIRSQFDHSEKNEEKINSVPSTLFIVSKSQSLFPELYSLPVI